MASVPEVGADTIGRLAVSSEFQGVAGASASDDNTQPAHREARIIAERKQQENNNQDALS